MAIGKVGRNGTLNENGAFYSVQDVNTLLENSGGGDLPTPTVADVGKAVVVDEQGKYALGEGGGSEKGIFLIKTTDYDSDEGTWSTIDKSYSEISNAVINGYLTLLYVVDGDFVEYTYYFDKLARNYIKFNHVYKNANNTVSIESVIINQDGTISRQ